MDQILEAVKKLSIDDLKIKLTDFGVNVGPILPTTKLIFQKKLAKKLYEQQQPLCDAAEGTQSETNVKELQTEGSTKTSENACKIEPAEVSRTREELSVAEVTVYYGVCPPLNVGINSDETEGEQL